MREHIEHLGSLTIAWQNVAPGIYMKMLNFNKTSGERTGLFRFVPDEGAAPPNSCHYHSVAEELFILTGRMSFDNQAWLDQYAYVFHPPFIVHGFDSRVPVETTFLARADDDLDFNFPPVSEVKEPYYVQGEAPKRGLAYVQSLPESDWALFKDPAGEVIGRQHILSEDTDTKEGTCLIRLYGGGRVPARSAGYEMCNEGFVLEGKVEADDGTVWRDGDYWHRQPGKAVPALMVHEDALILSTASLAD